MEEILEKINNYDELCLKKNKIFIKKYIDSIYDLIETYQFEICSNFDSIKQNKTISNISNKRKEYFTIYNEYVNSIIETLDSVLEKLNNTLNLETKSKLKHEQLEALIFNFNKMNDSFLLKKTNMKTPYTFDGCFFYPQEIKGGSNKKIKKNKKFTKTKQHKLKNNYSKKH